VPQIMPPREHEGSQMRQFDYATTTLGCAVAMTHLTTTKYLRFQPTGSR